MISVPVSKFRAHMHEYLDRIASGEVVTLTSHGRVLAEIHKPIDKKEAARNCLQQIAKQSAIGDIESPAIDDWGALT